MMKQTIIESMIKKKFETYTHKHDDQCAICLEYFKNDSEVSPLPCDTRHYFHSKCI